MEKINVDKKLMKKKKCLSTSVSMAKRSYKNTTSVNSTMVKVTLKANNRALAKALEKNRQELAHAEKLYLHECNKNQEIQEKYLELLNVAGLKNDKIESEVNKRVKKRLKNVHETLSKVSGTVLNAGNMLCAAMLMCDPRLSRERSLAQYMSQVSRASSEQFSPSSLALTDPQRPVAETNETNPEENPIDNALTNAAYMTMIMEESDIGEGLLFTDDDATIEVKRLSNKKKSSGNALKSQQTSKRSSKRSSSIYKPSTVAEIQAPTTETINFANGKNDEKSLQTNKDLKISPDERPIVSKYAPHIRGNTPVNSPERDEENYYNVISPDEHETDTDSTEKNPAAWGKKGNKKIPVIHTTPTSSKSSRVKSNVPPDSNKDVSKKKEKKTDCLSNTSQGAEVNSNVKPSNIAVKKKSKLLELQEKMKSMKTKSMLRSDSSSASGSSVTNKAPLTEEGKQEVSRTPVKTQKNEKDISTSATQDVKKKGRGVESPAQSDKIKEKNSGKRDTFVIQPKTRSKQTKLLEELTLTDENQKSTEKEETNKQISKDRKRRGTFVVPLPPTDDRSKKTRSKSRERKSRDPKVVAENNNVTTDDDLFCIGDSILHLSVDTEEEYTKSKFTEMLECHEKPVISDHTVCDVIDMSMTGVFDVNLPDPPVKTYSLTDEEKISVPSFITQKKSSCADKKQKSSSSSDDDTHVNKTINVCEEKLNDIPDKDVTYEMANVSGAEIENNEGHKKQSREKLTQPNDRKKSSRISMIKSSDDTSKHNENTEGDITNTIQNIDKERKSVSRKSMTNKGLKLPESESDISSSDGENHSSKSLLKKGKIDFKVGQKHVDDVLEATDKTSVAYKYRKTKPTNNAKASNKSKKSVKGKIMPSISPLTTDKKKPKSIFDLSLNDSIPVPSSISYGQFKDTKKIQNLSASPNKQSTNSPSNPFEITESEHGIMKVLGNGKRTKPRKPKETKIVTISENVCEDDLISPTNTPQTHQHASSDVIPEGNSASGSQYVAAGHTPPKKILSKTNRKRLQETISRYNEKEKDTNDSNIIKGSGSEKYNENANAFETEIKSQICSNKKRRRATSEIKDTEVSLSPSKKSRLETEEPKNNSDPTQTNVEKEAHDMLNSFNINDVSIVLEKLDPSTYESNKAKEDNSNKAIEATGSDMHTIVDASPEKNKRKDEKSQHDTNSVLRNHTKEHEKKKLKRHLKETTNIVNNDESKPKKLKSASKKSLKAAALPIEEQVIKEDPFNRAESEENDCNSNEAYGRRSRRAGAAVSYKEPTLNAKLRRGDPISKTLYDGKDAPIIEMYKSKKDVRKSIKRKTESIDTDIEEN